MDYQANLSAKQVKFATSFALHHNASLAAREAGYSAGCASVTGTRLLANDRVLGHIQALEAVAAVELGVTRQRLLYELQEAAALAKAKSEPMAMIAAWREIGKVCGLYQPERVKVDLNVEGQVALNHLERMTDAELLALIARGGGGAAAH